jgi:hypothetical protein
VTPDDDIESTSPTALRIRAAVSSTAQSVCVVHAPPNVHLSRLLYQVSTWLDRAVKVSAFAVKKNHGV